MIKKHIKNTLIKYPYLYNKTEKLYKGLSASLNIFRDTNYFKCFISAKLRSEKSLGRPLLLILEPANICNLGCPVCETGCGQLGREPRIMSFEEYKYILDQFDGNLKILYLYFMGESFLNKIVYKMIKYAADKGIYVSSCTNGEPVEAGELIRSGIGDIQFQIAGTTQEIHSIYRIGGSLSETLKRLKEAIRIKREYLLKGDSAPRLPKIGLGFILMKHNEHQINDFLNLAKNIGADEYQIIDSYVRNIEQGRQFLPADRSRWRYDEKSFDKGILRAKHAPNNYCEGPYSTVCIQVNGDVVPCRRDAKGAHVLGNVFEEDIYSIWNNTKYGLFRRRVATEQKNISICKPCSGCFIPILPKRAG